MTMKHALIIVLGSLLIGCAGNGAGDPDAWAGLDADRDVGDQDGGDGDLAPRDADHVSDGDTDAADADDAGDGGDRCDPASVAADISADRIRETLVELTGLPERSSHASQTAALEMLERRLAGLGVATRRHEYDWRGQRWVNLEIDIPGSDLPGEIYAAGAHYDSTSSDPARAPGADDNGSGTAGVVEIARVLSQCQLRRTVRLLIFSNEEAGMVGSAAYAGDARRRGDDIRAFLNLDMIAYGPADEDLDVATRPVHEWLAQRVVGAAERWVELDTVTHIDDHCG